MVEADGTFVSASRNFASGSMCFGSDRDSATANHGVTLDGNASRTYVTPARNTDLYYLTLENLRRTTE